MKTARRRDTEAELALRRALHRHGIRFRVDRAIVGVRRRADIVFVAAKVAVFVDGCFWHCCPKHRTQPKANAEWWAAKLQENRRRDRATNRQLRRAGWHVVRVWEHEDPVEAAIGVAALVGACIHRNAQPETGRARYPRSPKRY